MRGPTFKNDTFRKRGYWAALIGALLLSCGPEFDYLDIDVVSGTPFPIIVESDEIRMPSGTAIIVEVEPISSRRKDYDSSDEVELVSDDESVFKVREGMKNREFSFSAMNPGETRLKVYIDGHFEDAIEVVIDRREE